MHLVNYMHAHASMPLETRTYRRARQLRSAALVFSGRLTGLADARVSLRSSGNVRR